MDLYSAIKKWYLYGILFIASIAWLAILFQYLPHYDIHNFDLTNVTAIRITDRGILGNSEKKIEDVETVKAFARLLYNSTKIDKDDAILRISQGACDVELFYRNKTTSTIRLVKTLNRGVITSGQHCYRSDSLLSLTIRTLRQ